MVLTISAAAPSARLTFGAPRRFGGRESVMAPGSAKKDLRRSTTNRSSSLAGKVLSLLALTVLAFATRLHVRDQPARHVVAIAHALLDRMRRRHRFALGVEQLASEQIIESCSL